MNEATDHTYEFGPFRLETAERRLLREGRPISLTPKAFEMLLVLVRTSGRVVTKDDLMKRVWPDAVVEEANLARHVWALRRALGDGNDPPEYIETIPKLGYRFVAPVTELMDEARPVLVQQRVRPQPVAEGADAPAPHHTQPRSAVRPFAIAAGVVVVAALAVAFSVVRQWRTQTQTRTVDSGPVFLTDGKQDDAGAYWITSGRIYFSRTVTGNRVEAWTMNGDGSNPRRANTEIPSLLFGRWSPDGQKVLFSKETDTKPVVYLANADGSHEITLPFQPGNLDWSPDSSRFAYQVKTSPTLSEIFVYTLADGKSVNVTKSLSGADSSFSSDGKQIAFTSFRDGNGEIYVMDADGSNVRRVTNHPAFDQYPVFSPDGTQIAFQSNREDERVEIYLQNLNDTTPPRRLTHSTGPTGLFPKCWSADGTRMLAFTNRNGHDAITLIDVDPFPARLLLSDQGADLSHPRPSQDGQRLLHEARLADGSLEIRIAELASHSTKPVHRTPRDYPVHFHLDPAWSPDGSLIAFSARADGNSEIFVMNADGSGVRNLTNNPQLDKSPVFTPDGRHIVFARDTYGLARLFEMDLDGGNQHRLLSRAGSEMDPAFSPDNVHLAFAADRESRGLDVLLLDVSRPGVETVVAARRSLDTEPAFSPDGKRLAFIARSDGNQEIYIVNADGGGQYRLTHSREDESGAAFSRDGRQILFSRNRDGRLALYAIDVR